MSVQYATITKAKTKTFLGYQNDYKTVDGYTKRCGVPTDFMVQLQGSSTWYRVKAYQVSNSATMFVKTKDNPFVIVRRFDLMVHWMP